MAAALPIAALLLLLAWALSGVTLIPAGARALAERLGTPTAILHPGFHAGLPWPLGTTHRLENGAIHAIALSNLPLLSAGTGNTVQAATATIQILYRTGLTDADALHAVTTAAPESLVRATAGDIITAYAAANTLTALLGANPDSIAATLRQRLQSALDRQNAGQEILAVTIGAITPPAGADDQLHPADIAARTAIATAHAAAAAAYAQSRERAYQLTSAARATAAETIAHAQTAQIRFTADQQAAKQGGQSFLLERYFAALATSLANTPKTIIDHRLNWPEAPVLDLRPLSAAAGGGTGKEE